MIFVFGTWGRCKLNGAWLRQQNAVRIRFQERERRKNYVYVFVLLFDVYLYLKVYLNFKHLNCEEDVNRMEPGCGTYVQRGSGFKRERRKILCMYLYLLFKVNLYLNVYSYSYVFVFQTYEENVNQMRPGCGRKCREDQVSREREKACWVELSWFG